MSRRAPLVPDGVPVLSRGRHRNARRGACFMEMASFLAGERWSDHPSCTHPVLATLARCVNDMLDDTSRQRIALLIPEVVGLHPHDDRVAAALVLSAARAALPVAAEERQNIMALAIINAEGILAERDGREPGQLSAASRAALTRAPAAERWARVHLARTGFSSAALRASSASKVVALAVDGVARACVDDPEDRLVQMLRDGIDVVSAFASLTPETLTSTPDVAPTPRREASTPARPTTADRTFAS